MYLRIYNMHPKEEVNINRRKNRRQAHPPYSYPKAPPHLQDGADSIVRRLSLEPIIEEQRVLPLAPAIRIADAPNRNAHAVLHIQAPLNRRLVLASRRIRNIEFRDRALVDDGAQRLQRRRVLCSRPRGAQVRLRADAVDGHAGGDPGLDFGHHARGLGVRGRVEVVVVDVEFCFRVGGARGFKGDADKVFAENVEEYRGTEAPVLIQDFIGYVLGLVLVIVFLG